MEKDNPDDAALTYRDNVSIAWREVEHDLDATHLALVNASNEDFLRAVTVMGDVGTASDGGDGHSPVASEIARLDLKLNILTDLVSTLIYHQLDIPGTSPVEVSATGLSWSGTVPTPGATVYLQLYIKRGLPKPLCCYGEVLSTAEEHDAGVARVKFVGLTGAARTWLEKLIFRHHRREVAYQRTAPQS
ncbi:MAG: PilZ domain-containing protein [Pseudomonadota bacterium]